MSPGTTSTGLILHVEPDHQIAGYHDLFSAFLGSILVKYAPKMRSRASGSYKELPQHFYSYLQALNYLHGTVTFGGFRPAKSSFRDPQRQFQDLHLIPRPYRYSYRLQTSDVHLWTADLGQFNVIDTFNEHNKSIFSNSSISSHARGWNGEDYMRILETPSDDMASPCILLTPP